ncbi:hypothetical protein EDB82DRAFT_575909 [Fusarium venenatum]|uniref:uncharacterized protein n=1 Tax=Fusarium venenatum TaxID=56646 RepID=UPI001D337316|nr:hypothetical protein EDB82DRAFT_575909 [Fusarium venenatum]
MRLDECINQSRGLLGILLFGPVFWVSINATGKGTRKTRAVRLDIDVGFRVTRSTKDPIAKAKLTHFEARCSGEFEWLQTVVRLWLNYEFAAQFDSYNNKHQGAIKTGSTWSTQAADQPKLPTHHSLHSRWGVISLHVHQHGHEAINGTVPSMICVIVKVDAGVEPA